MVSVPMPDERKRGKEGEKMKQEKRLHNGNVADSKPHLTKGFRQPNGFFEDYGVWREAPVLIGTTKFEPRPDVKNIMITGGAGFM